MQNRKQTAWRRSRTFGDIRGGRTRRRMTDNIFARCHSLERPAPGDELPIVPRDNPLRDFFFPLTADEVVEALHAIPGGAADGLTHVWLRRSGKAARDASMPLAQLGSALDLPAVRCPYRGNAAWSTGRQRPAAALYSAG